MNIIQKTKGDIMNSKKLILEINKRIKKKSILKHPFYVDWKMGRLSKSMLKEYAKQYYKHVASFPQYLSAVHSKIDNPEDRKLVLQNLMDEENGYNNHPKLWIDFGEALGLTKDEIRNEIAIKTTDSFVNNFKSITNQGSVAEGIASLYAYEFQIPKVSDEKIKGLVKFYGVNSEEGLQYFEVHKKADVEHSAAERKLIMKYAEGESAQKKVLDAVDKTLDAYWNMLTGIQEMCRACS